MQENTNIEDLLIGLEKGEVRSLSKAITLIESTADKDQSLADELLNRISGKQHASHRIAITGVPGVGKSTFIERLGMHYISQGKKVAVLAVDPSSRISHGSILGDKTRMDQLSASSMAFIRPSPAAETLGGVTSKTRESIMLCEAAGYETILIETVGVGQSEIEVKDMADTFLLLMLAGAGDELQGIKRGIMEMADILVIHKAEDEVLAKAREAAGAYKTALHLLGQKEGWEQRVELMSSYTGFNEDRVFDALKAHYEFLESSGKLDSIRRVQQAKSFEKTIEQEVLRAFFNTSGRKELVEDLKSQIKEGKLSSRSALNRLKDESGLRA
jgi:LAO/AO transport system kinase